MAQWCSWQMARLLERLVVQNCWRITRFRVRVAEDLSTPALCQPCLEGLTCPTMSTLENLKAGSSPLGPTTVPQAGLVSGSYAVHAAV